MGVRMALRRMTPQANTVIVAERAGATADESGVAAEVIAMRGFSFRGE